MNLKNTSRLTFLFLFVSTMLFSQKKTADLAVDKEGIKIYLTRLDSTAFKEYRAVMTVNASIDQVLEQILNIKEVKKWNYKTRTSELVKKLSDTSWVFYLQHDLGWPVQNRDHVSRVTLFKKPGEYYISLIPENGILPERNGYIRLKNFKGYWLLKKVSAKKTLVIQQVYGNPEGNIPAFLANMVLTRGPFEAFKALRNRVENQK